MTIQTQLIGAHTQLARSGYEVCRNDDDASLIATMGKLAITINYCSISKRWFARVDLRKNFLLGPIYQNRSRSYCRANDATNYAIKRASCYLSIN